MKSKYRLEKGGHCIDRNRSLNFTFNGKFYLGLEGDTLASALLANGVRVVGRSFKFHRPRGVMSAGVEECNAILAVNKGNGIVPLERATTVKLTEGLCAVNQNAFPNVNFDIGRVLDFTRRLWPAGFYNKMFKWPNWHTFEWAVRATAGIGRVPAHNPQPRYRHLNSFCDVLIVGAGPVGLARALLEAESGNDVLIVEQDFVAGGSALFDSATIEDTQADVWLSKTLKTLAQRANIKLMLNATVSGYYDHNVLTIHDRSATHKPNSVDTFWKVRAAKVVLATGAIEQPLLFGNNDLPGIMLATAMYKYARRFGVRNSECPVVVTNNDLGWVTACAMHDAGNEVKAIVDQRSNQDASLLKQARDRSIDIYPSAVLQTANGSNAVTALKIIDQHGEEKTITCDGIAMAGGMNPTVHLFSQAGGKLKYSDELGCFLPDTCLQEVEVIGAAGGDFVTPENYAIAPREKAQYASGSQWVDFAHDVVVSDIELAVRENYVSVEHMKRYTTSGMSVDQGKTSNLNALSLLASLTDKAPSEVGTTTFRPQFMPVTMGAIAGNRQGAMYHPSRRLFAHAWHHAKGAVFDDFGPWKRPAYYVAESGEGMQQSIDREVNAVRTSAGLFDGSPLGKIEVKGPDAAEFLNRIYVNTVPTLKVGRVRYGLMLNENGAIIDDGVFVRIAEDHFLVNSTSAGADRIAAWMEQWHQCEWPNMDLVICPVTSQWSVATIAGPNSRKILSQLEGIGDLSTEQMPHMSFKQGHLNDGTKFRLQRVSFTGERSYELSVPNGHLVRVLEMLMLLGEEYALQPFGIEALEILRLEKGYLHVGGDTEGSTNPIDVGFGRIVQNKKSDFIGRRSLRRENDQRLNRRQFVGLQTAEATDLVKPGAHIVCADGAGQRSEGFVTSSAVSPTIGRRILLGLLENGQQRIGEIVRLYDDGVEVLATVAEPCVYDTSGGRMNA